MGHLTNVGRCTPSPTASPVGIKARKRVTAAAKSQPLPITDVSDFVESSINLETVQPSPKGCNVEGKTVEFSGPVVVLNGDVQDHGT